MLIYFFSLCPLVAVLDLLKFPHFCISFQGQYISCAKFYNSTFKSEWRREGVGKLYTWIHNTGRMACGEIGIFSFIWGKGQCEEVISEMTGQSTYSDMSDGPNLFISSTKSIITSSMQIL